MYAYKGYNMSTYLHHFTKTFLTLLKLIYIWRLNKTYKHVGIYLLVKLIRSGQSVNKLYLYNIPIDKHFMFCSLCIRHYASLLFIITFLETIKSTKFPYTKMNLTVYNQFVSHPDSKKT